MKIPRLALATAALAASATHAWLPGSGPEKRSIVDVDGFNLFNETHGSGNVGRRWLSASGKLRGVNLGSLFISEPWMMPSEWAGMGCEIRDKNSEFDCMSKLGQSEGDRKFQEHWGNFIQETDFNDMIDNGLNTVRIPLGYWMMEEIVYWDSEHFPRGGVEYLKRVCGWASDRGMYIILELHGAPGAQKAREAFTGQLAPTAGFYQDFQYDRAIKFVAWLRRLIHDTPQMRNVGMIGLVNENERDNVPDSLKTYYYPKAHQAIRDTERSLGITANNYLHIQMMNSFWGPANPGQFLSSNYFLAYDDHRYLKWAFPDGSTSDYISISCRDNRAAQGESDTIVGEWSISAPDAKENDGEWAKSNTAFYKKWFAAQVIAYEKHTLGWVFWSWKKEGDYRWSYKDALREGIIPRDLNSIANSGACNGV
ncbi:hypothetical protein, variant [Magnaporthiopsis poae ATCC 64411]|uniref:glucan endo-1,6-beta-glucosidase n=1 Tax=Magnaporthiopsis poae (strain ATCC 64411 / 73-15) TaxID=644358 RepID=A0A0C4E725_MAGP6|nr:hypothetical protein, variant [Magnaporthiopsis poae ATCC 64411]